MFKRSLALTLLFVCVFSFVLFDNISYAGPGLGSWINATQDVDNADTIMRTERDQYHYIQDDLETLIGQWNDAKISHNNQTLLAVIATAGAIVSIAASVPSGGSLYPAAYVLAVTVAKTLFQAVTYDIQQSKYFTSMANLLPLMDCARANVNAAYYGGYLSAEPSVLELPETMTYIEYTPGYVPQYDAYLSMAVSHLNTYEYKWGTLSLTDLTNTVKAGGSGLKGWYHKKYHDTDSNSQVDHVFEKFMTFDDYVVNPDLVRKYKCKGKYSVCLMKYRTPYEAYSAHRTKCGTGRDIDLEVRSFMSSGDLFQVQYATANRLSKRSVEQGCGRAYYTCDSGEVERHRVRTCQKWFYTVDAHLNRHIRTKCGREFRKCLGRVFDHDPRVFGSSPHSDTPPSDAGDDSSTASDDSSTSTIVCNIQGCTLTDAYDPSDATAAALHAYCSACSQYKCNGSDHSAASCGISGHYVCDNNSHVAASCGQSGHYNCDSLTHVEEQCTNTNANGDRCTYTFWRCLHPNVPSYGPSHTCTYPVAPPPAVFKPVLTLTYNSSTGAVSMTATANKPIFGADLYVCSPGDGSKYGTKIGWTSGNSNKTTYSLPVRYAFPSTVASGTYKFTLRVYPFNNSGSGDPWGTPYDVFDNVTVQ